jgi:hypothetical protein
MVETVATRTGLIWALKSSFVAYVASLPDGTVTAEGGATAREGAFHFPMAGLEGDPGSGAAGTLRFKGAVGFSGHHGMLRLALKDPLIVLGPDVCSLCAEVRGQQREIAQLPSRPPLRRESLLVWEDWTPSLTPLGSREFGGEYPAGEDLSPLFVLAPAGG